MSEPAAVEAPAPYGELVESRGLGASHALMLAEVAPGMRVLDVGCATGYLAERMAARGCSVVGFERDRRAAARAERHCERVLVGDVESQADRARIPGRYDVVLLGDVLEHLVDPAAALRAMHALVAPGGVVIASIPNVAAWTMRLSLLRGAFDYADFGICDRTHLRFFTRRTARELAAAAGFRVEAERFAPVEQAPGRLRRAWPRATDVAYKSAMRLWPELFAQQFVLRLRPARREG